MWNVRAARMADPSETAAPSSEPVPDERSRLKKLMLRGSLFEMGAYGLAQVLRLGSNLILTRLLVPEAFGLMTTVATINMGLLLLSDVGIEQSVIQSEDGDEEDFLHTAWSMQILRGLGLYLLALAITYPLALVENEMDLLLLIPIGSLNVVVSGFGSMREFLLRRHVNIGWLMLLELGTQAIAVAVMIGWASVWPSIWALVGGNIVRDVVRTVATHRLPGTHRDRFRMNAAHRAAIVKFGRWILGSSAVFFFASYSDRLILLPYIGATMLGVYSIAVLLSEAAFTVIGKVIHGVLFPIFSRVRLEGNDRLKEVYYEARLRLDVLSMGGIGVLSMLGPLIVEVLWDDRYIEAGWMLQVLCFRAAMRALFAPADALVMSLGQTRIGFINNATRAGMLFVGIPLGWHLGGMVGIIWAIAVAEIPGLFILWPALIRRGVFRPSRELLALGYGAVGVALGYALDLILRPLF